MKNKRIVISIILAISLTILAIVLNFMPSIPTHEVCDCGGCCVGCPGDCNAIGLPFMVYYEGVNDISKEEVNQLFIPGILTNIIVWAILMFLIYKFVYKK